MNTVLLTIFFFASAANADFTTRIEMSDATSCAALAERWLSYRDGMLRVTATHCDPAQAVPAAVELQPVSHRLAVLPS